MILFDSDLYEQKCIIDFKTKNITFIKMAKLLKDMGIKNHLFFLVMYDDTLQGVNPHASDLSEEIKLRIAAECKRNPWYFFREVVRIPAQGGEAVRYQLNRANLALIWCFLNCIDSFLTMPRQIGKTVGVITISDYFMYVLGYKCNIAMFAKDSNLLTENVRRMKDIRDTLPTYLFQLGNKYNTDNQESIEYRPNFTKYITFVAQKDKASAAKQGKGESFVWSHWDELAHYVNNEASYQSAIAASDTVSEIAKKNGLPCATIITTTAGYTSTPEGKFAHKIKSQALRFSEKLYDSKDNKTLKEIVDNGSGNNFLYLEFSYSQLGKDEKWLRNVTRNKSPEVVAIDYLNKWIHGSSETILSKRLLDLLENNIVEPVSTTIDESIIMRWYADQSVLNRPEYKNIPYIIGSDTSDNIGKDFTTIVLVNPKDMAVVMTCRCNQSNMVCIANIIFNLLMRFPNSVFVPEKNKAASLLDMLITLITTKTTWDCYKRIYNAYVQEQGESFDFRKVDINLGTHRKAFGFKTTGAEDSRKLLYSSVLTTTVERNHTRIFDKIIIDEIFGLVVKNGRVDHSSGGNDDTLIAYLLCCWFIMFAKNVYLYGIQPEDILTDVINNTGDGENNNSEIKLRIAYLEDKINSKRLSALMEQAYIIELKELKSILPEDTGMNTKDMISVHQIDKLESCNKPTIESIGFQFKSIFS